MSQENVDVIRAFYDRWDACDLGRAFELLSPNVQWETLRPALAQVRRSTG